MRTIAWTLLALWLIFVLPGWVGGMLYAGRIILLPPDDLHVFEWASFFFGMYVVPIAVVMLFWQRARKSSAE